MKSTIQRRVTETVSPWAASSTLSSSRSPQTRTLASLSRGGLMLTSRMMKMPSTPLSLRLSNIREYRQLGKTRPSLSKASRYLTHPRVDGLACATR